MTTSEQGLLRQALVTGQEVLGSTALGGAIVDSAGRVETEAVGRTHENGEPVSDADQWHIGSCFKAINALVVARLVERGTLEWSTPIAELFSDLAEGMAAGWEQPTVAELLTCQSGMRANPTVRELLAGFKDERPPTEQRTELTMKALATPPKNHGKFLYSNVGYTVVGAAIDRLVGKPFEEVLDEEVLTPLEIRSAGWGPPPHIRGHGPKVQLGSLMLGRGKAADPDDPRSDNPTLINPAGRLHLTLGDWAKIHHVFLAEGAGLVEPSSVERMLAIPDGNFMSMGWSGGRGIPRVHRAMQGSNGRWVATALMSEDRSRTVMVIANDGRTRTLRRAPAVTATLLAE